MTCPSCKCPECRRIDLQAVLAKHTASLETLSPDEHNALQLSDNRERESWKDTYGERAG